MDVKLVRRDKLLLSEMRPARDGLSLSKQMAWRWIDSPRDEFLLDATRFVTPCERAVL